MTLSVFIQKDSLFQANEYIIVYWITNLLMRVLLVRFHCQSMRANSIIDITGRIASRSTSNWPETRLRDGISGPLARSLLASNRRSHNDWLEDDTASSKTGCDRKLAAIDWLASKMWSIGCDNSTQQRARSTKRCTDGFRWLGKCRSSGLLPTLQGGSDELCSESDEGCSSRPGRGGA